MMKEGKIYDIDYIVVDGCRRCSMDKSIVKTLEETLEELKIHV